MENVIPEKKVTVGISRCLLGESVRWDGGHKLDRLFTETLGQYVDYIPVCPEVEAGLGIPREPIRLEGDHQTPRIFTINTNQDVTDQISSWALRQVEYLETKALCGFIFKCSSPSCGMEKVKVYNDNGVSAEKGVGVFARAFMNRFPLVPVAEDRQLRDKTIFNNYIQQVFMFRNKRPRWQSTSGEMDSNALWDGKL